MRNQQHGFLPLSGDEKSDFWSGYSLPSAYPEKSPIFFQESKKKFNCTTPFGLEGDSICSSPDRNVTSQVAGFYIHHQLNASYIRDCLYPCRFQKLRLLKEFFTVPKINGGFDLQLLFDSLIRVTTAKLSYTELELVAELGGYVGLFLGISVFHLSNAFEYLLQYMLQNEK